MPRTRILITSLLVAWALHLLPSGLVYAAPPFARHGVINRVDAHGHEIVVNDMRYVLPSSVDVYLYNPHAPISDEEPKGKRLGNGAVLRDGMHIGFNVDGAGPQRIGRIFEAWVLRPNTLRRSTE